jgi:hypothetical protein
MSEQKRKFLVTVPIAGAIHIMVEATDAQEAKQKAWDKIDEKGDRAGDVEWEFCESITTGNVCHAPYNETVVRAEFKRKDKP